MDNSSHASVEGVLCAETVDEAVVISQHFIKCPMAGRQAQGGTLGEDQRVCRDCGQNPCDQPAFFSCRRESLVWGCCGTLASSGPAPLRLLRTAAGAADKVFSRTCSQPQGTAPSSGWLLANE